MSGIYKERDELDGIEVRDSGLNEMLLGPELAFRAMNRFDVTLSFEFPVAYDNNGIQALQDHLVRISLGARL